MDYRNDLEAARLRINTLEAKLEESKAALDARDAELAECRVERDRLRQTAGTNPPRSSTRIIAIGASAVGLVAFGFGLGVVIGSRLVPDKQPIATAPTVIEDGPRVIGKITPPPPDPPNPPVTVSGQTNLPVPEVTIDSILDDIRPKVVGCYKEEAKAHPKANGSLTVVFDIDPDGKVSQTKFQPMPYIEPWWSKSFEACVNGVYRKLTFPNESKTKTTASGHYFFSALDLAF